MTFKTKTDDSGTHDPSKALAPIELGHSPPAQDHGNRVTAKNGLCVVTGNTRSPDTEHRRRRYERGMKQQDQCDVKVIVLESTVDETKDLARQLR